eukprot:COSAG05_NODE_1979_length_3756_cov_7.971561_1_plen_302_part_10
MNDICCICMADTLSKPLTLGCGHDFHLSCLKRWLPLRPACPICNAVVDLQASTPPASAAKQPAAAQESVQGLSSSAETVYPLSSSNGVGGVPSVDLGDLETGDQVDDDGSKSKSRKSGSGAARSSSSSSSSSSEEEDTRQSCSATGHSMALEQEPAPNGWATRSPNAELRSDADFETALPRHQPVGVRLKCRRKEGRPPIVVSVTNSADALTPIRVLSSTSDGNLSNQLVNGGGSVRPGCQLIAVNNRPVVGYTQAKRLLQAGHGAVNVLRWRPPCPPNDWHPCFPRNTCNRVLGPGGLLDV